MHDTNDRPIDRLQADWRGQGHSTESATAVRRLAAAEPTIAALGAADLAEIVGWLNQAGGATDREHAAAIVRAMLRSGGVHPLVPRALLQAILPGLVGVARRLSWGSGGDWEGPTAFFVDLVTTTWELIAEWTGEDRPYAVLDLLSAARCRMRRELLRHRTNRRRLLLGLDQADLRSVPWRRGTTDLDELATAIDELASTDATRADAAVLYAHRVLGYSMTEIARLTGRSRRHLGERRDRAARLLTA